MPIKNVNSYEDKNIALNLGDTQQDNNSKHVPFAIVEAYKTMRTNLMFILPHEGCKKVVISSSNVGEGKSTTTINLAIAFAQMGSKVLVIDADMRRPSIYKKLKLANTKGLSSYLVGFCGLEEIVAKVNPYLDVITSGPIPPNPSEMLGSAKMEALLESLSETYDYIFIDMPPINVVSDALILATKTDGLIFVIQDLITTHDDVQKALSSIDFASAKLLGLVLNGSSKNLRSKYRYRYMANSRYTYSYSYSLKEKDKK